MGALSPGLYLHAHLPTKGHLPMCFPYTLEPFWSDKCTLQSSAKLTGKHWLPLGVGTAGKGLSDFQTRSGLIKITAFLLERNQALGRGKGLQLRLSRRSTATAAHSGLQPVPDTVVRLFGRWFYLMLFLCSLGAQHCGRAAPSGPGG